MTWLDEVRRALEKLGGTASLSELYDEIKRRPTRPLSEHWDGTVRATLAHNSSDSKIYRWKRDVFRLADEKGEGVWRLRRDDEEPVVPAAQARSATAVRPPGSATKGGGTGADAVVSSTRTASHLTLASLAKRP
jgi:hypothetical protein